MWASEGVSRPLSSAVPTIGARFLPGAVACGACEASAAAASTARLAVSLARPIAPLAVVIARRTALDGTHPLTSWASVHSSSSIQFQNHPAYDMQGRTGVPWPAGKLFRQGETPGKV